MYPNQRQQDDTFEYPASGGTQIDPVSGRRTIWRGRHRGMVPQIGRPPAIDPLTGQTQAQKNAGSILNPNAVDWAQTFPNLPNGQSRIPVPPLPEPSKTKPEVELLAAGGPSFTPATGVPSWNQTFPNLPNGQSRVAPPVAPQAAPAPIAAATPPAMPTAPASPPAPVSAPTPQNPLASKQTPYGTITPIHSAHYAPNWQEQIIKAHPEIGVKGSPQNLAFLKAFNQHGKPERGMATAQDVVRQFPATPLPANPSRATAHDDLRGGITPELFPPGMGPGLPSEPTPPVPEPAQPPAPAPQYVAPIWAPSPTDTPQRGPTPPTPAAPQPVTHAEAIDQLKQTASPRVLYHANPALDPLSAPRITGFLGAPFQSQNYPPRPAIHPLDAESYMNPETNPLRLAAKRVGDFVKSPFYRSPKRPNRIDPLALN